MLCDSVGMMKANNWLYNTTDSGRTWTLLRRVRRLQCRCDNIGPYAVNAFESVVMPEMWIDGGPDSRSEFDGGRKWQLADTIVRRRISPDRIS